MSRLCILEIGYLSSEFCSRRSREGNTTTIKQLVFMRSVGNQVTKLMLYDEEKTKSRQKEHDVLYYYFTNTFRHTKLRRQSTNFQNQ